MFVIQHMQTNPLTLPAVLALSALTCSGEGTLCRGGGGLTSPPEAGQGSLVST